MLPFNILISKTRKKIEDDIKRPDKIERYLFLHIEHNKNPFTFIYVFLDKNFFSSGLTDALHDMYLY